MSAVAVRLVVLAAATLVAAGGLVLFSDPVRWPNGSQRIFLMIAGAGDVQERAEKPMRLAGEELVLDIAVGVAHGLVRGQVEHCLTVPTQVGCAGSRYQFGGVVPHNAPIEADDDDSHRIPVRRLDVFLFASL